MSLKITTTLSLSSQSVANNTSTVTWKVKYSKSSSTYNNNGAKYYVNVDGNRVKSGTWKPKKGTTSGTIASGTTTIKHNADGTHAQIRAYAKVYDTGFSPSSADDYSPYLSLPTIKRTYTVSYNANGGSGAPASQTKTYGVNLTLSSTIPTRAGYAFKGWATSSTGAVAYQAGGTYSANSAVTLYAVWELLGNVKIDSYSAFRCDSSGNAADEGTWGKFTCTYILSGQGLNEGSVAARYRASDVSTWSNITNISQGEHIKLEGVSSLSVNVSCLISNISQDNSYIIELTVTDSYGNTAIASDYISQAYFTMDFLAGGKGIGIGTTASCDESKHPNGLLTCGMDADFNGMTNINGIPIKGCHKIRLSTTGEEGTYTENSIGYYMTSTHRIYLEEIVSEQLNGIILVWSYYANGAPQEGSFQFTVIPKTILSDNPSGGGISVILAGQAVFSIMGAKYIYVRDSYIFGHDNNNKTGTGTSGIKYSNNAFVLRWVYGF